MQVELVPTAAQDVTDAVSGAVRALTRDDGLTSGAYRSRWRAAALADGVERDPGYAPSPRSSRGATRT